MSLENIDINESQLDNLRKRIEFLYETGKFKLVIEEAAKVLCDYSEDYTALLYMSLSYHRMNHNKEAESSVLTLLEKYPESDKGHRLYSFILLNSGRYELSVEHSEKAIELNPNDAGNYYTKACSLRKLKGKKDMDEIKNATSKALSLQPDNGNYHAFMAELYVESSEYELAEKECRIALELEPLSEHVHIDYSVISIYLGKLELGEKHLMEALALEPNNPIAHRNLKVIKRYKKNPKKYYNFLEKQFFKKDLKKSKESKSFLYLVKLLMREKHYGYALRIFKRYLMVNPTDILKHIEYANMLYEAGAVAEAYYYLNAVKKYNSKEKIELLEARLEDAAKEMKLKGIKRIFNLKPFIYATISITLIGLIFIKVPNFLVQAILSIIIFYITIKAVLKGEFV